MYEVYERIEGFYNPVRRHKYFDRLSPLEFDRRKIPSLRVSTKFWECNNSYPPNSALGFLPPTLHREIGNLNISAGLG